LEKEEPNNMLVKMTLTTMKPTFSFSVPSDFLSSRFDNFPGATAAGNVVENI
jgi:hypothetical protein